MVLLNDSFASVSVIEQELLALFDGPPGPKQNLRDLLTVSTNEVMQFWDQIIALTRMIDESRNVLSLRGIQAHHFPTLDSKPKGVTHRVPALLIVSLALLSLLTIQQIGLVFEQESSPTNVSRRLYASPALIYRLKPCYRRLGRQLNFFEKKTTS